MPAMTLQKIAGACAIALGFWGSAIGQTDVAELMPFFQSTQPAPLHALIPTLTGCNVLRPNPEDLTHLKSAVEATLEELKNNPVRAGRANEAGLYVEDVLTKHLLALGFDAQTPLTQSGKRRSVGYPDIALFAKERAYYLEVKTYNAKTARSTMRTFYLSPSKDPKVTQDAAHLLVAFELEEPEHDVFKAVSVRLLDLYNLECGLKFEFNASNRDLYEQGLEIFEFSDK